MERAVAHERSSLSRRELLARTVGVGLAVTADSRPTGGQGRLPGRKFYAFSKHLQWLDYGPMAETAADIGFDGVDLTVRPDGHVLPERVEDDLPRAVEAATEAGIEIKTIVTRITDPGDPLTEKILRTAGKLRVRYYRMGYYRYEEDKSVPETLALAKPMLRDLVAMSRHFDVAATYQNHAGDRNVGAPLWDLYELFQGLDPRWVGCQFDIRHATVEGGTAWPIHFRLMQGWINTIVAKDFYWDKSPQGWRARNCPLGEGMVDFETYFQMVRQAHLSVPICLHLEYPIGGAEHGERGLSADRKVVLDAMRRDLSFLREKLHVD